MMTAFWDNAQCSLIEVDRRFGGAYCLHHQGDKTSVNFYETVTFQVLTAGSMNIKVQKTVLPNVDKVRKPGIKFSSKGQASSCL
jgi:hypothetical protein